MKNTTVYVRLHDQAVWHRSSANPGQQLFLTACGRWVGIAGYFLERDTYYSDTTKAVPLCKRCAKTEEQE